MNPVDVANKFVSLGRQNGKTQLLIDSLPDEQCAVMVASNDNIEPLKQRIISQRPGYNVDNVTFVVYGRNSGWRDTLLSKNMDVYVDNDVLDEVYALHVKAINDIYGKVKAA